MIGAGAEPAKNNKNDERREEIFAATTNTYAAANIHFCQNNLQYGWSFCIVLLLAIS